MSNTSDDYFSLGWFKDTVVKSIEKAVDKKVGNIVDGQAINNIETIAEIVTPYVKPYKQTKLVGDLLTVVFNDGSIISKPGATTDDWDSVRASKSEVDVLLVMASPTVAHERKEIAKIAKKNKVINDGLEMLEKSGDFKIKGNHVYLRGTSRTIPPLLVERFAEVLGEYEDCSAEELKEGLEQDDEYQGLKRFFMWCCLNPRAEVANDLYNFLHTNSFRITRQGFFVALRNVVTVGAADKGLVEFVSNAYNKVKAVWKKDPGLFCVVENNGNYSLRQMFKDTDFTGRNLGNLTELYLDLPNMIENRYTDAHTRTFDIRVGQVVNMPMEECNWSTQDCAHAGLHFTSDQIHYVGCGDTSVLILINPMKVVGIGGHKGRCYEYLPIMTVPREEATAILHDGLFDTYQLDEQYALDELDQLAIRAQAGFVVETTKHQFNLPSISLKEIQKLVVSLQSMTDSINKRIIVI
jgi:hypothetical protein